MSVALDTSAVLAYVFKEPGRDRVVQSISNSVVCTVNLAEAATKLAERGYSPDEVKNTLEGFIVLAKPLDSARALANGALRIATRASGLSLGDRACIALARQEGIPVLTADRAWSELDLGIEIEVIR